MHDGKLERPAPTEGRLAVGEDGGERIGADDRRRCTEVGSRLIVDARGAAELVVGQQLHRMLGDRLHLLLALARPAWRPDQVGGERSQ